MQDLLERADDNESEDVQSLRELSVTLAVEGCEPCARVRADGGHQ